MKIWIVQWFIGIIHAAVNIGATKEPLRVDIGVVV